MTQRGTIEQLEGLLDGVMSADAAWCRARLAAARARLRQGKPADRILQQVVERATRSAEQVQRRRESAPRPTFDEALPITARREDIVAAIRGHQVVVVAGETGSGKTTQLPKLCLEAGRGLRGLIGCTQPRRIAARAMAARVAEELGTELGGAVGYQVRFRERMSADGYIKFMTDGILLAEASGDRELTAYDTLIIDEAHERSLNIDFLLGYLRQLLPRRPDLKLIITSATIDTEKFAKHFGDAPAIEVSGRGYPVEVIYRPLDEKAPDERRDRDLYRGIVEAVRSLSRIDRHGDVLVFLAGEREIHEARDALERASLAHTEVLPLYARLSAAEQQRVFHPGPARRVILATNVAETSLTVPRIRFVVDSGFARISRYAHRSRIQRLPIEPISRASAAQRAGRCGRLGPGTCIRLYSEEDFDTRPEFTEPEILRTSLASVILRMLGMGLGEVEDFPFIDPPAPRMINDAYHLLFELGALDGERAITPLGRRLAGWPLDVRLARMVQAGAEAGCTEDLLALVAGLSIQDPRERPLEARAAADQAHDRFADEKSDFVTLLQLWAYLREQRRALSGSRFRRMCKREFLNWQRVLEWFDLHQQLRDQAREEGLPLKGRHGDYPELHRALLTGLLSQVGQRHPEDPSYLGARNRSFHIFPGSGLFGQAPKWIMAAEIVETSKPYARTSARIEPGWIEEVGAHVVKRRHFDPHWSRRRGRVMAWEQVSLYGLVLVERRAVGYAEVAPVDARRIFITEALVRGEFDSDAEFLGHNRELREELRRIEDKRRQRDVLADERALFDYLDARVPAGVHGAASFRRWWAALDAAGRSDLRFPRQLLLREDPGEASAALYPDRWQAGGDEFALDYRFAPGDPADGVTVTVPLEFLNLLDPGRAEWLVPGYRQEKVFELLRTLPKPLRRALTPVAEVAEAAAAELQAAGQNSLRAALADFLARRRGLEVQPRDFDESALPPHLRLRVVVTGAAGEVIAQGRDLAALQARHGGEARRRFMDREGAGFQRDGIAAWDFGELPETVTTPSGARAWPALVDAGDSAGLRLFDDPDQAAHAHYEGVLRLLALQLRDKLGSLARHHGLTPAQQLAWSPVGAVAELVRDLVWHCLVDSAGDAPLTVRDPDSFAALVADVRGRLGGVARVRARDLGAALEAFAEISRALPQAREHWPEAAGDVSEALDDLLYPGFLRDLEPGRLAQYPRYLAGLRLRLERLALDPSRDARLARELAPHWSRYTQHLAAGDDYSDALDAYRWLLHEYRVSLFAQQLGTVEKVSAKRLRQAWQAV